MQSQKQKLTARLHVHDAGVQLLLGWALEPCKGDPRILGDSSIFTSLLSRSRISHLSKYRFALNARVYGQFTSKSLRLSIARFLLRWFCCCLLLYAYDVTIITAGFLWLLQPSPFAYAECSLVLLDAVWLWLDSRIAFVLCRLLCFVPVGVRCFDLPSRGE